MTLQLKSEVDFGNGLSASVSVKLKDPVFEYKINSKNKSAYVTLTADYEFSISAKAELIENVAVKKLRLGFWGCPGIGGIELSMVYSLAGSVTGTYTGTMCVGAEYSSSSGFSIPKSFQSKGFSLVIEASLKAGLQVNFGINDIPADVLSGYVYAEVGAKGSIKRTSYSDSTTPKTCVQTAMYLYLECGAKLTFKVGTYKSEYSREYKIWKDSNSPVRVVHHYEDGKEVCSCTRGQTYEDNGYYTVGTSNYWGSGWSGGGSTGYDRYGNPVAVFTYDLDEDNNATITGYNGGGASITIPETIDGYTVTGIGNSAFKNKTQLISVSFPDSVSSIGYLAFYNTSLGDVVLPVNLEKLGGQAFGKCYNLNYVFIPKSLQTCTTAYAWDGTDYYGPFNRCSALKTVEFEEGITTVPANLFYGCDGIEEITIPNTVTTIGNKAFREASSLKNVALSSNLTTIGELSFYMTDLESIVLPKSLTKLCGQAFGKCYNLSYVFIPKSLQTCTTAYEWDGTDYYGPFNRCSALKTVEFEEGITTVPANLFYGCDGIEEITVPYAVTAIESYAFSKATSLKIIQLPETIEAISSDAFAYCTTLETFVLPPNLTGFGFRAFSGCTSLKSFTWNEIYAGILDDTFNGCSALETFYIPDCVTLIGEDAFAGCSALSEISGGKNVSKIQSGAFYNCSALNHVVLGESVWYIGSNAFKNCESLSNITISDSVESIGSNAFQNCTALASVKIPDSVTSIGAYIFDGCEILTDVTLGTGLTKIPSRAFSNCSALESIVLPYRVEEIEANAFLNDIKLTSVTIPRRTDTIASNAFSYPDKLTIYGVAGTYAETFAGEIGAVFAAIDKPATAIQLSQTELKLNRGSSARLSAAITPADFTDEVAWKRSNTEVATVADDGTVKAVSVGECTISFVAGNQKATCSVTVVQPVTSISLNRTSLTLDAGETYQLVATANLNNAAERTIEWSSSDPTVAIVSKDGMVTALKKGTATITASATDGSGVTKSCTVTVLGNLYDCTTIEELQSSHPYAVNCNDIWQYTLSGASGLYVSFSAETSVESGSDYLYIYAVDGTLVGKYTGTELAGKTVEISGDTVRIKLVSDSTYCEYGFVVTSVMERGLHTHKYTSVITAPTCTEQGFTMHTCACGAAYIDDYVAPLGHDFRWVIDQPATETEDGCKHEECTRCGETQSENTVIPAIGESHLHSYSATVTEPTCTEKGYTTYTCTCGDSYVGNYVDALEHDFENGICTHCGEADPDYVAPDVPWDNPFVDVPANAWYYDSVKFACQNGLFSGMSATTFEPDTEMTRAMLLTVLWRMEGKPNAAGNNPFTDVLNNQWFTEAVVWASENGIINGMGNNKFAPEYPITREQMAAILYRYAAKKGYDTSKTADLSSFIDGASVSPWANKSLSWANAEGLINGAKTQNKIYLDPQGNATRAQVAAILMRFLQNVAK